MKRQFLLSLFLLLVCGILSVSAGAPTESEIPVAGTELCGFTVRETGYLNSAQTDWVRLEHLKTGAQLIWLANDSIRRSFVVSFMTPVLSDTGVPHVLEHSVLGGTRSTRGTTPSSTFPTRPAISF